VDPWESFNRKMFGFNESLDQAVIRPVAVAYQDHAPVLVQKGVSNFFGNLRDLWSAVNSALQAKPGPALQDTGRFLVNSTIGIYGLFDLATPLGLERHSEDLGQTLGRWGVGTGPYAVLPFFGPSTVRDAIGLVPYTPPGWWMCGSNCCPSPTKSIGWPWTSTPSPATPTCKNV
jgi:phospholipid-binding lipoprotein MlaA